jgi:hypothetical protein
MTEPLRFDLHVHSRYSPDSGLALEEIAARVAALGLAGFAVTDHNTTAGHQELPTLREKFPRLLVVPGIEVSTVEGHLLAFGINRAPPVHRPLAETVGYIRDHGGEPVLSHPFRRSHGVGGPVAEGADVNAIETRNGHNSGRANARANELAGRRGLGGTGGSDAHALRDVGRAFTEFRDPVTSLDDLLAALRSRRTVGGGRSLSGTERVGLGLRTALLRIARGFRPV